MDGFRIFDMMLVLIAIALFYAGFGIGTQAYGFTNFTAENISITGNLYVRGDIGDTPSDNSVVMFNASCPTGWVRQTQYDNAYPRGNDTYSATAIGASTHPHPVPSHNHGAGVLGTDDTSSGHTHYGSTTTSSDGNHDHQQGGSSATMQGCSSGCLSDPACNGYWVGASGTHSHSMSTTYFDSYPSHSMSGNSDSTAASTDGSGSSDPPYITVVFCSKA